MLRRAFARERKAKMGALRLASHLKSRNNRAKLRAEEAARKFDALRVRHARFMGRDHIVMGGKAMRLVVIPRSNESLRSEDPTRDHYSTVPMDAEGHDLVGAEPAAQALGFKLKRKRKKVKCHRMLVSVFGGAAKARDGGGWEYTYDALKLMYLTNAALGHGSSAKEGQWLEADMDRRTVAAAMVCNSSGQHRVESDTRTHMRPC